MFNWLGENIARVFGEEIEGDFNSSSFSDVCEFLRTNSISEVLPYFTYDEKFKIFLNKGSYGFAFEMSPLIGFEERMESEISAIFKSIMPLGSSIQFLLVASPKVGLKLDAWQDARLGANEVLRDLSKKRVDFFKSFAFSTSRLRDFKLIVSCSFPLKGGLTEHQKREAQNLKNTIMGVFESLGLGGMAIDSHYLISFLNSLLAPKRDLHYRSFGWNKHMSISDQISYADTSLQVTKGGLVVDEGEFLIKNYSAIGFPDEWSLGLMGSLIGDDERDLLQIECPFMISYAVNFVDDRTLKAKLMTKGTRVEDQSQSVLSKYLPSLYRDAGEWRFVRQQLESQERLVQTSYQVALFSNPANISRDEQRLMSLYRSNKFELVCDRFIQLPAFLSMLPMSWGAGMSQDMSAFGKTRVTLSHEPINLLPIQGEWKGTKTPGMLFTSRKGQVFTWSPFDSNSNYNVAVVGQPGKGKSFTTQMLLESILSLGGRAFVLDLGRSYEKFCNRVGGNHLVFSTKSNTCINPFSKIPTGEDSESAESRQDALLAIKSIVALMAAPTRGVSDIEYSFIEKSINQAWGKKQTKATITDVIVALESQGDVRTKDLSTMLYPYGEGGSYGRFFEGESNIDFSNFFNVIELEELKAREDLQGVVFQVLQLQIMNEMFLGDRKTPWAMVLEEFWDLLKNKRAIDFAERTNRLIRRFRGSLIAVTQNLRDFYRNDGATAIFENSEWLVALSQKAESIAQLKKSNKFEVTEHMQHTLNSLKTVTGKYAEMMVLGSDGYAVGRLIADPFSRILYSSKAEEYSRVKDLQKQGLSLTDAVTQTAKETFGEEVVA